MAMARAPEEGMIVSRGRLWTSQERALLEQLASNGCTAVEAARRLGRPEPAVRAEAWRLEVAFVPAVGRWTKAEKERLIELADRHSYADAGVLLGRSGGAVRAKAQAMGVLWAGSRVTGGRVVGPRFTAHEDAQILTAARRRRPIWEVTIELRGRSEKSVWRRLQRLRAGRALPARVPGEKPWRRRPGPSICVGTRTK